LSLACAYVRPLPPGVYGAEVKFNIEKLGVVCVYPCLNILVVVYCDVLKVGAEPSMVVQLWKWFIDFVDVLGIVAPPADVPLVCGLVCEKLTSHEEKEELTLVLSSFFLSLSSINLRNSLSVPFACLSNA
jgi:hypothetical protein